MNEYSLAKVQSQSLIECQKMHVKMFPKKNGAR